MTTLQYESDELEKSVYQDYDSDSDVPEELKQDYVDEQTGDAPLKRSVARNIGKQRKKSHKLSVEQTIFKGGFKHWVSTVPNLLCRSSCPAKSKNSGDTFLRKA